MALPITPDGATLIASFEHVDRVAEIAGVPIRGWNTITGGGTSREGRNAVYGAGAEQRGLTDGKVKLEQITAKLEVFTWHAVVKPLLAAQALLRGQIEPTAYQQVDFTLVDQWQSRTLGGPSLTITYTVRVSKDTPDTPPDGNQFYKEILLDQVIGPQEVFA